ncbi:hypothetical protein RSAG8_08242, partial [Rhizoctonia solani AG-8 WAC10335]
MHARRRTGWIYPSALHADPEDLSNVSRTLSSHRISFDSSCPNRPAVEITTLVRVDPLTGEWVITADAMTMAWRDMSASSSKAE